MIQSKTHFITRAALIAAIPGLFIGCLVSNLFGMGVWDIVLGSLTTLLAAYLSYRLRRHPWLVPLPPILLNAVIIGGMLYFLGASDATLIASMLSVGAGPAVVC